MMFMNSDIGKFVRFYESDFGQKILKNEVEYIHRELKDCKTILDIGCGIGPFEQKLRDFNIIGLDSSIEMLKEARKRSDKNFVLGDAEDLCFGNSSFDAVLYVTTLEFVSDYQRAIREAYRVTKPYGKLLVMMLNPESEYFHEHFRRKDSYFRRIKYTDLREISVYISKLYKIVKQEYFLGIKGQQVFDASDRRFASLYAVVGEKR